MSRVACGVLGLLLLGAAALPAQEKPAAALRFDGSEAEAALAILQRRAEGRAVRPLDWRRLRTTEGYRRLQARETAMGRTFTDSAFSHFLLHDTVVAKRAAFAATLAEWRRVPMHELADAARRFLPPGTRISATVYPLIKPRPNSFVFEPATRPAIMLFLEPGKPAAQLRNTVIHELHHIGLATACADHGPANPDSSDAGRRRARVRQWLSAFGEGHAMLAAAGGPDVHPHASSPEADRVRWDGDVRRAAEDLRAVEQFLEAVLDGRLSDAEEQQRGMGFFGVQGPWYTVGWVMARAVERARGRTVYVQLLCDPVAFVRSYDAVAATDTSGALPRWTPSLLARLDR